MSMSSHWRRSGFFKRYVHTDVFTPMNEVTRLANGVRVVTDPTPAHYIALGTYILAGSRYETNKLRGVSHFIDRMSFKTTKTRSRDEMLQSLEQYGGHYSCTSSRENISYQSTVFPKDLERTAELIADTIRCPKFKEDEIAETAQSIEYELKELEMRPEHFLPELLHIAAYQNNTLGNSIVCPDDRIGLINKELLEEYNRTYFSPDRIVVGFSGISHQEGVKLAEKLYGDMKPSATKVEELSKPALYTGGIISIPENMAAPPLPNHPVLTHLLIGLPSYPIGHPDAYASAILQHLLGGGGSFSAGGPGKGMYSRFYTNVLNTFGFMESCLATYFNYSDHGLFAISASCDPRYASHLGNILCSQMSELAFGSLNRPITNEEAERAKALLKASLIYNLESKVAYIEDLAKQILFNHEESPIELCQKIDQVSINDLYRVANDIFCGNVINNRNDRGAPTMVVQGNTRKVGNVFDICESFKVGNSSRNV